ncbi:hypothetical protein ACH5RR_018140 [Cinchona calisaya]|uniref:Uncharacterized protein n=1 Tax=Cinchona calisaya TaxID=153742 RepID=A0ABD2ZKQ2_9GENT
MMSDDSTEMSNTEVGCEGRDYDWENELVKRNGVKILGKGGIGEVGIYGVKSLGSSRESGDGVRGVGTDGASREGVRGAGQSKVVHETESENEDNSGNSSEAETDEEVEEETEEEVEEETEKNVEKETEEVIPTSCKKQSKKKTSSP